MSDERLLAIVLASAVLAGGSAAMMRTPAEQPKVWYEVIFPPEASEDAVNGFFRSLAGDRSDAVVVLEIVAAAGRLQYRLGLPERMVAGSLAALRSYIPGIEASLIVNSTVSAPSYAWSVSATSSRRPLRLDAAEEITRAIITSLSTAEIEETAIYQVMLGPRLSPIRVDPRSLQPADGVKGALRLLTSGAREMDGEERKALAAKAGQAGFRVALRVGVAGAGERRARILAGRLMAALRTAEAPGVSFSVKRCPPSDVALAREGNEWPMSMNVRELTALSGWPLGSSAYPGVRGSGPLRLPSRPAAKSSRVVGVSAYPGSQGVEVGLTAQDALQHMHVLGPTGVGKSTLLAGVILQDIEAGRGVVVVDPKGDLVADVLARIPSSRSDDVVLLDPADDQFPVGLNVLQATDRPAELVADQVLAVFHGLYKDNWGPRTQDILHASLLTLAGRQGMTLCALPVLLSNEHFRSKMVAGLTDEIALKPFWRWFEQQSEGERQQAIAPVMNKLRAFLLRPRMRGVIGQGDAKFNIEDVFTKKRIVLVSLAKGLLGPEAAALLGSLIVSQLWQAALGRVRIAPERRHPVMVYVDEFQDYLHLPTDLTDVLTQARGLGVGLTLAHQHLAQLPPAMRSAVMANARSRVVFQLGYEDARLIAGMGNKLSADDLQGLPRYEAYASLVSCGEVTPWASIRTATPGPVTADVDALRTRSRHAYGRPVDEVEAELRRLVEGTDDDGEQPLGRRRRS